MATASAPQTTLKVIFTVHFVLTFWGSMSGFLMPLCYTYLNAVVLAFGFWSIVSAESAEPVLMFLVMHGISVIQDIILLGIYAPRGFDAVERGHAWTKQQPFNQGIRDEYRFSLGMAILNLILKPVTGFLLFRIMRSRTGDYEDFTIPGINHIPGFSPGDASPGRGYEDIDQPSPYRNNVETATGHDTMEKPPGQP